MRKQIQLILATIGLTALIWVYADLTSQESYEVTLTVRLSVPAGSESVIRLKGSSAQADADFDTAATVPIQVTLVGPKAAIADIEHLRRSQGLMVDIPVSIGESRTPDVIRTADIRENITRWARDHSLRIVDLSRQLIEYQIEQYVKKDLTIEVTVGALADKLKAPPRVDPAQVKVRLLASQWDQLATVDKKLEVSIEQELRTSSQDTFEKSLVGLRWHGLDVTYIPDIVQITVQRSQEVETTRITAVPMYELWPAYRPEEGLFRVEWEDGEAPLQHIEVSVPAGTPRLPTNKDVIAYVTIEPEDLQQASKETNGAETAPAGTRAGIPRPVRFIFADDLKDVRVISLPPTVRFRVVRVDKPAVTP